jgi:hypothetical protein
MLAGVLVSHFAALYPITHIQDLWLSVKIQTNFSSQKYNIAIA